MENKKEFFDWFTGNNKKFTINDVDELVELVKVFNAGAVDEYLSKHVDKVYHEWMKSKTE